MAVQTTSNLTNSIAAIYKGKYVSGAKGMRLYDQLAVPYTDFGADGKSMEELSRGTPVYVPFLSDMAPGTSAISQTADVTPQTLVDATGSVTPTSRGEALQWSELLSLQVYTDYTAAAYEKVGMNAMESIDLLALDVAVKGSWVERATTRSSLDAGTASHRASDAIFRKYDGMMQTLGIPGYAVEDEGDGGEQIWSAIMHPFVFHDISESGNIDVIGQYSDSKIHLNWELAQIGRFRLLSSRYAKVFWGAGVDNGSGAVADGVGTASSALATSLVTDSNNSANASYGLFWMVGTEETSSTNYPKNEPFKVLSISTTTITLLGQGVNGGLRFAHAATDSVLNNDSVYTIVFGGPRSLVKVFPMGFEYGQVLDPDTTGLLKQFSHIGWKYYGNYALVSENRILRAEVSTSYEA